MKIVVNGFHRFNPRKDLKSMPWLRLENNFYDREDFFDQDVNTTWLFIFLLCQCAQKVSDTIELSEKYLISKSKLTKKQFFDAISNLEARSLISLHTNGCDRIRSKTYLTNEHNEHNEHNEQYIAERAFDIEMIYNAYPKKAGKVNGMKKLHSTIKTQDMYDKIMQSVKIYAKYCKDQKIDTKYIKQFSTWVNQECWNDELDLEHDPFAETTLKPEELF